MISEPGIGLQHWSATGAGTMVPVSKKCVADLSCGLLHPLSGYYFPAVVDLFSYTIIKVFQRDRIFKPATELSSACGFRYALHALDVQNASKPK